MPRSLALALMALGLFGGSVLAQTGDRPNIIVIFSDDHALRAVSARDVQRVAEGLFAGPPALAVVGPSAPADRRDAILSS